MERIKRMERERARARCKIKDGSNLIEIVAIITHSGARRWFEKEFKTAGDR